LGVLDKKVVIVTGAGRGIGRTTALAIATEGGDVVVNDIGIDPSGNEGMSWAETTAADIRKRGGSAISHTQSIGEDSTSTTLVSMALNKFGRLDGIVNNAGMLRDKIFHKLTPEDWDIVMNVNLRGSFLLARAAARVFRDQHAGSMVHITSGVGLIGNVGQANYAASKLGLVALSTSVALDLKPFGVRSNCVAPFAWNDKMAHLPIEKKYIDEARQFSPEQIAPLIVCLLSDLSAGVSGQIFGIAGNEVCIYSQARPVRVLRHTEPWSATALAHEALPFLRPSFSGPERTVDVFNWYSK